MSEGVGKTTLIKKVCAVVRQQRHDVLVRGFYTEEVREGGGGRGRGKGREGGERVRGGRGIRVREGGGRGARVGFDVVTMEGERGVLARVAG